LQLAAATLAQMHGSARAPRLVPPVWSRISELWQAGHDPGALAALRYVLVAHQPTRRVRCRACRRRDWRSAWRRPPWPCATWIQVRSELLGLN
jgi:hypothetical protein